MGSAVTPAVAPVRQEPGPRFGLGSLWEYLQQELKPYPGRGWLVLRMTLAATLMMLWVVTFRIPNAALGVYYTLLISRESASETVEGAFKLLGSIAAALLFTLVGNILFSGSPVLHFCWVGGAFLTVFFFISAIREYRVATGFGFLTISSIPLWDFPTSIDRALSLTLWAALSVVTGAGVVVLVEAVFAALHRTTPLEDGVIGRLSVVEAALRDPQNLPRSSRERVAQYSEVGTGLLRRYLARGDAGSSDYAREAVLVGLTGRLIDLTAALLLPEEIKTLSAADLEHLCVLADRVRRICEIGIVAHQSTTVLVDQLPDAPTTSTLVQLLNSTVELLGQALDQPSFADVYLPQDQIDSAPVFKRDAFTNPEHLVFALRGGGAAMMCFLLYHLVAWRGLSSSLATCMITALSTTGSSRQKQLLRVLGAITGGLLLGIGSQTILLPAFDTIVSFGLMFALVTAFASWVATSSPRISFYGLQVAFAFDLVHLRAFGPQVQLVPARDNVAGILLGLLAMWLIFDQWNAPRASDGMRRVFIHGMRQIVTLMRTRVVGSGSKKELLASIRAQRDAINGTFTQVRILSDSVLLEFNSDRDQALSVRRHVRTWTPELRAFFLLQVTLSHVRLANPDGRLSPYAEKVEDQNAANLEQLADYLEKGSPYPSVNPAIVRAVENESREDMIVHNCAKILQDLTAQFLSMSQEAQPGDDPASQAFKN